MSLSEIFTCVVACAAVHVGFSVFGLEPVFEAAGEGIREVFSPA